MSKIAAIQMCSSTILDDNLTTATKLVQEAAADGAQLVVLPEMFAQIGTPIGEIKHKEHPGSGRIQDFLSQLALRFEIWVVGGTIPLICDHSDKLKAACLVFNPHGELVARYDKIHLFNAQLSDQESYQESATFEPGNKIVVIDTPLGRLGVCVCFDIRFPKLFTAFASSGVDIIAIPAAFTQTTGLAHWEILTRCRALDCMSYIVGAAQGGLHPNGRRTHGHSLIVNPWGAIVKEVINEGAGIICADIDRAFIRDVRAKLPVLTNQTH